MTLIACLSLMIRPVSAGMLPKTTGAKKAPADKFCISQESREDLKAKYKDKIERTDCSSSLNRLRLARLDCTDPQSIRDLKSAMLGAIRGDDSYAEGFARAVCPGKAEVACMNPEPQCRLKTPRPEPLPPLGIPDDKFRARLSKHYLDRLKDLNKDQADTMVNHYLELHGKY